MGGSLRDLSCYLSACLSPLTTTDMENPQCLPCIPLIHLSGDSQTQTKLPQPPPEEIKGEEEYEVAEILSLQGSPGCYSYLVSWKGYSSAKNTWEPEWNLQHAQTILKDYK